MIFGRRKRSIERILVVEDEPLVAFDNEHYLSDAGYEVVETTDRAAVALETIARGDAIHLVLADIELRDGSGLDVAAAAHAAGIAVMFVTGHCPADAERHAIGYLGKPYQPRTLIAAIQAIDDVVSGRTPKKVPDGFRLFTQAAS
ncbi:DNA-binding response OmpR family regulator [Sphingomonas jejuensis]|uniref:DNA-binding response OmpR family regulator n=1 Tax=Sphingomonas jejuensis TaxID=904715 RepID=A0ABX0XLB9_9SPHN|nr:response regulator [Sphingomonas jejuensis]NJC33587.1 DNA-binding response OmpR family regulator [Sphingomonas jejuensis]